LVAAGCVNDSGFHCNNDSECALGSLSGFCEANGFCSFADSGCPPGRRYGAHSGPLSGSCVGCGAEVCNGLDDDCDGTIDNGCPASIELTNATQLSPQYGSTVGDTNPTPFDDSCPAGQVFVGAVGTAEGRIDHLAMVCGALALGVDSSMRPYAYFGAVTAGETLPTHGTYPSTAFTLTCPDNTIVSGVVGTATAGGSTGGGVASLHLTCSPVQISGSPGNFTLAVAGNTTTITVDGTYSYSPFSIPGNGDALDRIQGLAGTHIDWLKMGTRGIALTLH
jgi:hypothetical protein